MKFSNPHLLDEDENDKAGGEKLFELATADRTSRFPRGTENNPQFVWLNSNLAGANLMIRTAVF